MALVKTDSVLPVRVDAIRQPTKDVRLLTLSAVGSTRLPAAEAGAHINLYLPGGMIRPYSLLTPHRTPQSYEVAIKHAASGRGGSQFIHGSLSIGTELMVSHPQNRFSLNENAPISIFIAGGIGITPIWSMIQRMQALRCPWSAYYACESIENGLFCDQLKSLPGVGLHPGGRGGSASLNLTAIVSNAPVDAHLYCCGPPSLLDEFHSLTKSFPATQVHSEAFSSNSKAEAVGTFTVKLARSGRTVTVPPGHTILHALREQGINATYSCEEGVCGVCEVTVLAGTPDHRDTVLTRDERTANNKIMICCSRSQSSELLLDI